jgi:hypothetical protein
MPRLISNLPVFFSTGELGDLTELILAMTALAEAEGLVTLLSKSC